MRCCAALIAAGVLDFSSGGGAMWARSGGTNCWREKFMGEELEREATRQCGQAVRDSRGPLTRRRDPCLGTGRDSSFPREAIRRVSPLLT
jgi:hypothetical protein